MGAGVGCELENAETHGGQTRWDVQTPGFWRHDRTYLWQGRPNRILASPDTRVVHTCIPNDRITQLVSPSRTAAVTQRQSERSPPEHACTPQCGLGSSS